MESKYVWIIFACAWIGTAIAVSVGIYITHSAICLWAMLIPTLLSTKSHVIKNNENVE